MQHDNSDNVTAADGPRCSAVETEQVGLPAKELPKLGAAGDERPMRWRVIGPAPARSGSRYVVAQCACGVVKHVKALDIEKARSSSCAACAQTKHGHTKGRSHSRTFTTWWNMMRRCYDPKTPRYPRYGGRGVTVCEHWRTLQNFVADMGEAPDGLTLDRINNDGNYEPGNCRWATYAEQNQNNSLTRLSFDIVNEIRGRIEHGEKQASVARRMGLTRSTVSMVWKRKIWANVP